MHLKNLQTNNVFNVPDEMAKEFVEKDKDTFQIIDKGYKPEETKVVETPMFDMVVKEEKNDIPEEFFENMSRQELRDYCKENGIKFNAIFSKEQLIELIKKG